MEFCMIESVSHEYYYICLFKGKQCFYDYNLVKLLGITYHDYITLMMSYGAVQYHSNLVF